MKRDKKVGWEGNSFIKPDGTRICFKQREDMTIFKDQQRDTRASFWRRIRSWLTGAKA